MINKKAQSEVITTVLIILLVLAAVVIVWQVVGGTVSKGAKQVESKTACLGLVLDIVKIDTEANKITVTRKTGSDNTVVSNLKFLVAGISPSSDDVTVDVPATDSSLGILESKTWIIEPIPDDTAVPPTTDDAIAKGDKIEVAPILADGTQCDVVASANAP